LIASAPHTSPLTFPPSCTASLSSAPFLCEHKATSSPNATSIKNTIQAWCITQQYTRGKEADKHNYERTTRQTN
jgi:hypothetical protein